MFSFLPKLVLSLVIAQGIAALEVDNHVLEPKSDHNWPGMGNRHAFLKRSPQHAVALQQKEHFVWGSPNSGFGSVYTNLTLDTSINDDVLVISMERFQDKLQSVVCTNDTMTLQFKSNDTYEHVIEEWTWVNTHDDHKVKLIANRTYPGCGNDSSRQPWHVSNFQYDPKILQVRLNATQEAWSDTMKGSAYSIDFGHYAPPSSSNNITKRSFWNDVTNDAKHGIDEAKSVTGNVATIVENAGGAAATAVESAAKPVINVAEGAASRAGSAVASFATNLPEPNLPNLNHLPQISTSKTFSMDMSHTFPANLFAKQVYVGDFSFGIECDNCGSSGTLELAGHIESGVEGFSVFTINATPKSLAADLTLTMTAAGTLSQRWDKQFQLLDQGIPGFTIPGGVLTVGPNLEILAGFTLSNIGGSVVVTSGLTASIPDSSSAEVDFIAKKKLGISGWVPKFTPKPISIQNGQVNAELSLYVQLNIAISLDCMGTGFQTDIGMKIPTADIQVSAEYEKQGSVCPSSTKQYGVKIDATAGATLLFQAYEEVMNTKNYIVNEPLYDKDNAFTFPQVCIPFGTAPKVPSAKFLRRTLDA